MKRARSLFRPRRVVLPRRLLLPRAQALPVLLLTFLSGCTPRPGLDAAKVDVSTLGAGLPKGFLLGTATAAHQVEGGQDNDWTVWEESTFADGTPHVARGERSGLAADSWNRFDDDLALMQTLGATAYRFSVEWSRLEPSRGAWRGEALERYRSWLVKLRAAGITPMVTLFHFTLPRWVAEQGGFENRQTMDDFAAFAARVATELGAEVDLWCPINEPNVYALQAYLEGTAPPGKRDDTVTQTQVFANLLEAHGLAAARIRAADVVDADGDGKATLLTVAHHVRPFQAASNAFLDTFIAGVTDDYFNESTPRALLTGRILLDIPGTITIDRTVPGLAGSLDVLGINYYSRNMVRADLSSAALSQQYYQPGRPASDLGWEVYPDGLYQTLTRFAGWGVPLYVTENGLADARGDLRVSFLERHLLAVERAVADGADVRGYFHWSLLDNFEWSDGFEPRFGLFSVDYAHGQARTATPAVATFRAVADRVPR